jgi:hypothetical protein
MCTQSFIGQKVSPMHVFGIRELREKIGAYAAEAEAGKLSVIARNGTPLTLNIPFDETLMKLGAHKALAVKLFQDHTLTLVKAAKLAALPVDDFIALLGALSISAFGYDASELVEELDSQCNLP